MAIITQKIIYRPSSNMRVYNDSKLNGVMARSTEVTNRRRHEGIYFVLPYRHKSLKIKRET